MIPIITTLLLVFVSQADAGALHRMKLSRSPLTNFDPAAAAIQLGLKYGSTGSTAVASLTKELEEAALANATLLETPGQQTSFLNMDTHGLQLNSTPYILVHLLHHFLYPP